MTQLKTTLLCGSAALTFVTAAAAQTFDTVISDGRTSSVSTSTTGNTQITSGGSITLSNGTALTIDSNANVENAGNISVGTANGATAIFVTGDRTFSLTQSGDISLTDSKVAGSNEVAPDFSDDRYGFRLAAGSYTGNVSFSSDVLIDIDGDNSFAMRYEGDLDGNLTSAADIQLRGAGSTAIQVEGDVSGNFDFTASSAVEVRGANSNGIVVSGDVGGRMRLGGTVIISGFEDSTPDGVNDDTQRQLDTGNAVEITGDVAGGVLIDGALPAEFDFVVQNDNDPNNDGNVPGSNAQITVQGNGVGLLIDGATIGRLDTSDVEVDTDALVEGGTLAYGNFGLVNRGVISADGIYDGVSTTAARFQNTTIADGIRNDGAIDAVADAIRPTGTSAGVGANAVGLALGSGFDSPLLLNRGRISAIGSKTGATATALSVESGAQIMRILNSGTIEARLVSDTGDAIAVSDASGTVTEFVNKGVVSATIGDDNDNDAGTTIDAGSPTGRGIAIDFSANTSGVTITNTVEEATFTSAQNRRAFGRVIGDVITGSGDDTYQADAGSTEGNLSLGAGNDFVGLSNGSDLTGDIDFGTGANALTVNNADAVGNLVFAGTSSNSIDLTNGARFEGHISTNGTSNVSVNAVGSEFLLRTRTVSSGGVESFENSTISVGNLSVTSRTATVDGVETTIPGTLGFTVAPDTSGDLAVSRINASGSVSLADGTEIRTLFTKAFTETAFSEVIISTDTLSANIDALTLNADGTTPFLFEQSLSRNADNDIILSLERKSSEDLGLTPAFAGALDPLVSALTNDDSLGSLLFNATTQEEFLSTFKEFMPGPIDAPLAYARAQNNSVTTIVSQRVESVSRDEALPRTAWLQQQGFFINRGADENSNGYDGSGFVLAAGADTPLGPIDIVGGTVHFSSARYDEQVGDDFPFNRLTYGIDLYAAEKIGSLMVDGRVGYALSSSESERNIDLEGERRSLTGEWDGSQITANARARYEQPVLENYKVTPFASVDFVSLSEDGYTEEGNDVVALTVEDRDAESLRANAGLSLSREFKLRPSAYETGIPGTLTPQLSFGWGQELLTDDIEATYRFGPDGDAFTLLATPEDGAAFVGADINYQNQYAKVQVGVSGQFSETTDVLALRASVGLK
ncbi:MAG: autotransporter domain-containing protein, partial [Pseudomonadota bacterium]